MTLPRTTADVLSEHVLFEVESIDRMYLNVYQPKLQYGGGVSAFFVGHRGHKYASSVLMAPITEAFVANIHHFIAARGLDLLSFGKGEDKDAIAHRYLAAFPGREGCCSSAARRRRRGVPHPEAPQSRHRGGVLVADTGHAAGQLLLLLLRGRGFRPVLHQVLQLLPVQRQAVPVL
jgi:hypothetical protein